MDQNHLLLAYCRFPYWLVLESICMVIVVWAVSVWPCGALVLLLKKMEKQGSYSIKVKFYSLCERRRVSLCGNRDGFIGEEKAALGDMMSDQRLFSCITCGILTFSCAAILQPKGPAARYLASAECGLFGDWTVERFNAADDKILASEQRNDQVASSCVQGEGSYALGLIRLNYGDSSDSEDVLVENNASVCDHKTVGDFGADFKEKSCLVSEVSARFEMNTRYGSVGALKPKDTPYVPKYNQVGQRSWLGICGDSEFDGLGKFNYKSHC